jgi:hypothetical protein
MSAQVRAPFSWTRRSVICGTQAQGRAGVDRHGGPSRGQQPTVGDRRRELPRRHRAHHAQAAPSRRSTRTNRLHRVSDRTGMARQRARERVQLHQQRHTERTHRLGITGKRPQPAPHRRGRPSHPDSDRPMPGTGRLHPQRGTDDIHTVGPPQQARHSQQHMRHRAADTASAARPQSPHTADMALSPVTPRSQNTPARTDHITSAKTPFDLRRIGTYHDHGCLQQHQGTALPSGQGNGEGRCAFLDVTRPSSHTNKGPPADSPCERHRPERRYTAAPSSYEMSLNNSSKTPRSRSRSWPRTSSGFLGGTCWMLWSRASATPER